MKQVEVFFKLFILLYADDSNVFAETELQGALNGANEYFNISHMTLNAGKSKLVMFSKGKIRKKLKSKFRDIKLHRNC